MRPIEEPDFSLAAALLQEGFPQQGVSFWLGALQRLRRYGDNAAANVPLGWFMLHEDEPIGLVLTPATLRRWPDGRRETIVNFSSWYVRPAFRWRAFLMLRKLVADDSMIYTDLTPTAEVQAMLLKLGFSAVNPGVSMLPTAPWAWLPAGGKRAARVRVLGPEEAWPACGLSRPQVDAHRELGCLPLLLEAAGGTQLIICRRTRWRGFAVAQLVYAESLSQLLQHRTALARCLRREGLSWFVHDARSARSSWLSWFRRRDVWFCRGADWTDRCDAFASELCIVHADTLSQPPLQPPPQPAAAARQPAELQAPVAPHAPAPAPGPRQAGPAPAPC